MWLKKLFVKEANEKNMSQEGKVDREKMHLSLEEDSEANQSKIFTVPEKELDLRYSLLPIISSQNLSLPKQEINLVEFALFQDIDSFHSRSKWAQEWLKTIVIVTDKQILLNPDPLRLSGNSIHQHNILHICYGRLEKVQYVEIKKEGQLWLTLKDSRQLVLRSERKEKLKEVERIVGQFGFPKGINEFFAFKYGKVSKADNGWSVFNFERQMTRQGVTPFLAQNGEKEGKAYQLINNAAFELSPTYPIQFIVPSGMTEKDLLRCASFRTKERLPILTYFYQYQPQCYASLFRCSQNKGGLLDLRCPQDEKMIQCIDYAARSVSSKPTEKKAKLNCKIYDARGYYAALGNKIAGKGYENEQFYNCQVQFLDIPNIHAVRESYNRVKNYNPFKEDFTEVYGESGWLDVLYLILTGAKSMAKCLIAGKNVIVHCSDGWDRTTQLSCLAQIMIDPYYRTLEGFIVLFQKDWRHCGHKFRQRSGQYNHSQYHAKQTSPIFIQYLDCLLQLMNQFPLSFEFNLPLLNFLADVYQSYVYGSFMTNNVRESEAVELEKKTVAVWADVLERREEYVNMLYRADGPKVLEVDVSGMDFRIWRQHFLQTKTLELKQYQHYYRQVQINRQLKEHVTRVDQELSQLHSRLAEAKVSNVELEMNVEG